jgi:ERCC4-related helicase
VWSRLDSCRNESTESGESNDRERLYVSMPLIKRESIERRKYQQAIFDSSKDANCLIILPTGLGKTVIAAMIVAHRLLVAPTSKVIFLAPTKPLLKQHRETVLSILDLDYNEIRLLTGEETPEQRVSMWFEGKVIFATPQVIVSDLSKGRYDLGKVSLMIFDEAHRGIGKYPYVEIAQKYFGQSDAPQVIGLTASPGWSEEEIAEIKKNLGIEKIEARTEMSMDIASFIKPIDVQWVRVQLGPELALVARLIDEMMDERLKELVNFRLIREDDLWKKSRRAIVELQKNLADQARNGPNRTPMVTYQGLTLTAQVIRLSYAREFLNTQGLYAVSQYLEKLVVQSESMRASSALKEIVSDARFVVLTDTVRSLLERGIKHPKLVELLRILHEEVRTNPSSRILVFVQYRNTVKQIVEELRSQGISAVPFIGQSRGKGLTGMSQKKQMKTLRDFKDGLYSTLVATSVAEEGLDIAECDIVVLYDAVPSEVRYIQRRGQVSRHNGGRVVTLITAGTQDERYYLSAISKEKKMRDVISRIKEEKTTKIEDYVFGSQKEADKPTGRDRDGNDQFEERNGIDEKCGGHFIERSVSTSEEMDSPTTLVADNSVVNWRLTAKLRDRGYHLITRTIRGADYIIGNDVGIIYVKHKDLCKNNDSYRTLSAKVGMVKEVFPIPILICEGGDDDRVENEQKGEDSFYDAIAYFTVIKRIPTIPVANEDEGCNLIHSLMRSVSHWMREET